MGAFAGMTELLGDLVPVAASLGYPDSSICVLKGDIELLAAEYPETHKNLMSCGYHKDGRTPIEYGQDLVASWIYEDSLMAELTKKGLQITGAGADKKREILARANVTTESDCCVSSGNTSRKLEIMNDYKGYWSTRHKCHLRDEKYTRMTRENAIFLGVAPLDKKYFIADFANPVEAKYIPYHRPYYGKPAYEISVSQDRLKELDFNTIAQEIATMF